MNSFYAKTQQVHPCMLKFFPPEKYILPEQSHADFSYSDYDELALIPTLLTF